MVRSDVEIISIRLDTTCETRQLGNLNIRSTNRTLYSGIYCPHKTKTKTTVSTRQHGLGALYELSLSSLILFYGSPKIIAGNDVSIAGQLIQCIDRIVIVDNNQFGPNPALNAPDIAGDLRSAIAVSVGQYNVRLVHHYRREYHTFPAFICYFQGNNDYISNMSQINCWRFLSRRTVRITTGSDSVTPSLQVYARDSMDRFGDDLCQYLLSYLSLKDRFRYECVSKHLDHNILYRYCRDNDQGDFRLEDIMNANTFESILNKCRHVTHVKCMGISTHLNNTMFESLTKHCDRLDAVHVYNCRHINGETIGNGQMANIKGVVDHYGNRLKVIDVRIDGKCDDQSIVALMTGLSQMSELIDLLINTYDNRKAFATLITTYLPQIGSNCPAIKRLSLDGYIESQQKNRNTIVVTSDLMIECKCLTHLSLGLYINEMFFDNIGRNFPRLQCLVIKCPQITDSLLNSLSQLAKIQTIRLYGCEDYTQTALMNALNNCPKITMIHIERQCIHGKYSTECT
ncbi:unnamed protein product, partial [Medioppia subpectinata]